MPKMVVVGILVVLTLFGSYLWKTGHREPDVSKWLQKERRR